MGTSEGIHQTRMMLAGLEACPPSSAQAYRLAQHDILTGLPNRSLLNERLRSILAQAHRDGTHVACLFIDFDHFKRI